MFFINQSFMVPIAVMAALSGQVLTGSKLIPACLASYLRALAAVGSRVTGLYAQRPVGALHLQQLGCLHTHARFSGQAKRQRSEKCPNNHP
jgi:hypothetical protein